LIVRDDPTDKGYKSFAAATVKAADSSVATLLEGLRAVFRYKNTWILTLVPGGVVGPLLAFSGLWGVPFITTDYGIDARPKLEWDFGKWRTHLYS
jgi:hypothetical protein